ncbi:hypothetical protein Pse7367_1347 [Thalassoporum mexicanum PCC 7367]|uniref:hypothetical protein n=1 Tax=Thalassoporum mexicanum TaxID=3457544 RepID=UPI00029FAE14|nr:hypothetical protein [Pseudanabaena sp. PCC 7367]AFY69639.1 hypothetical protein Pse7367_1347 [Pseudanabaena sp. PCC 7367]
MRRSPAITSTGELYQPARLYYGIADRSTLCQAFANLDCMHSIDQSDRSTGWEWRYGQETQSLKFKKSARKLAASDRPIVLGNFGLVDANSSGHGDSIQGYFDLDSFDRVVKAIAFFDAHISRQTAHATGLRIVNRCFAAAELPEPESKPNYDQFFSRDDISPPKANEVLSTIESIKSEYGDTSKQRELVSNYITSLEQQTIPEIEELPINFYEDGEIFSTEFALKMRQKTAYERWLGNYSFNPIEAIFRKRFL